MGQINCNVGYIIIFRHHGTKYSNEPNSLQCIGCHHEIKIYNNEPNQNNH